MAQFMMPLEPPDEPKWKRYQAQKKKKEARKKLIHSGIKLVFFSALVILAATTVISRFTGNEADSKRSTEHSAALENAPKAGFDSMFVRSLVQDHRLFNLTEKQIDITARGKIFHLETSIDTDLQNYLINKMDRRNSRYIGMVALEPESGRVVVMAAFDKKDPEHNICLDNRFPAASIFKIVTAAAAVETCGLKSSSSLKYNGMQHTLYKRQLKDQSNKYTNHLSLRDSFAKSVNPVFGKIGMLRLGKESLQKYAEAFGFNAPIAFEKRLPPSRVQIGDDPYNWAEIASGFNRETTLSPLHGAILAAIIVNRGQFVRPYIIEKITTSGEQTLFHADPDATSRNPVVSPDTAREVYHLMEATVRYGTGRKAFEGYKRDRVLSKLSIGGKTGSINNKSHDLRYDWFVGFAAAKDGSRQLAVGIFVAHEKYIGTRAGQYARMAIKKYFDTAFSKDMARTHAKQTG
jgi:cell division protein FtsI/penicillin-binding protein 2